MDLEGMPALDIAASVTARDASVVEVVEHALDRIVRLNPPVNAIAWLRADEALADARAADARLASGGSPRALEGVPFTAKDLTAIADGPSNQGSRAFEGWRAGVDAEAVARLKAAGAILVATTTSSEFGNRPTTESDLFGSTHNPWDLSRTCGGSSGGAGVSAALGFAPLNLGSDAGGSIRIPSFCCGVFGLKPQRARITMGPVLSEEWGGLDVYGPITRTVADAAAFLDATAGPSTGDPYWAPPPAESFLTATREERPLRVAVAIERDGIPVDPACARATWATADLLASLGHQVEEKAPNVLPLEEAFLMVSTVGIGAMDLTPEQLDMIEPRTRLIFDVAEHVRAIDYVRSLGRAHHETRTVLAFWDDYDVLLTPTLSRPAPPIGEVGADMQTAWEDYRRWLCWTWPFNVTGQPAANVPAGFSPEGLPLGVQIVGRAAGERTVLSVCAQIERARPWTGHRPPIW